MNVLPPAREGFSRRWVNESKIDARAEQGFEFVMSGNERCIRVGGRDEGMRPLYQYLMEIDDGDRRVEQAKRVPEPEASYTGFLKAPDWRWWRLVHWAPEAAPFIGIINWFLLSGRYFRIVFRPVPSWALVVRLSWQPRWKVQAFSERPQAAGLATAWFDIAIACIACACAAMVLAGTFSAATLAVGYLSAAFVLATILVQTINRRRRFMSGWY